MGPQHIRDETLYWIRKKTARTTGIELFIPVMPELRAILDATHAAGLPHCTFHGLRKGASRRLAEAGCTPHEIAAIAGHATLKEVERYRKAASRKRLAESAMDKMRTGSGKPAARFARNKKKS